MVHWISLFLIFTTSTIAPQIDASLESRFEGRSTHELLLQAEKLRSLGASNQAISLIAFLQEKEPQNTEVLVLARRMAIQFQAQPALEKTLVLLIQQGLDTQTPTSARKYLQELKSLRAPNDPQVQSFNQKLIELHPPKENTDSGLGPRVRSLFGVFALLLIVWLLSSDRKNINYRTVAWGLGLQLLFAILIIKTSVGQNIFDGARTMINKLLSFTDAGASFLFGNLYKGIVPIDGSGPVQYLDGTTGDFQSLGVIFAIHILPTVIFFGSLMAILYHFGIIQKIVQGIAWVMTKTMRTSGPESLSAAANIFVGQTEAPLVVKPFLNQMSLSELMAVMTGGFATVAGGVLAAYARFGIDPGHLLAASVMSAPAALVVAKMMLPSSNPPGSFHGSLKMDRPDTSNILDAATAGASDGLKLAVNVGAMLLAFISLVAFANWGIGNLGDSVGWTGLSLQKLLGYLFYPLAWLMGADSTDLMKFGELLGLKIAVNEFVAFIELGNIQSQLSPRSATLATYALCGFANFSSIGIQIGGISGVAPKRRQDLAKIGLKAMLGGAIASWLTACIAGILLP